MAISRTSVSNLVHHLLDLVVINVRKFAPFIREFAKEENVGTKVYCSLLALTLILIVTMKAPNFSKALLREDDITGKKMRC